MIDIKHANMWDNNYWKLSSRHNAALQINIKKYKRVRFELDVVARYVTFSAIEFSFIPVFIFFHAQHLDTNWFKDEELKEVLHIISAALISTFKQPTSCSKQPLLYDTLKK